MFSWRLILAPDPVLDYVAAHEAAHLVELNHSRRFWALVAELDPGHAAARDWLRRHGAGLHAWRFGPADD
jgi:predicted metal-dependent hydrolase